jgi:hypothetical protein
MSLLKVIGYLDFGWLERGCFLTLSRNHFSDGMEVGAKDKKDQ